MSCKNCNAARETNGHHRYFDPLCLWCGARLIQKIGRLEIPASESIARRRVVLTDWVEFGHSETELRRLAKLNTLPLASLEKHAKIGR